MASPLREPRLGPEEPRLGELLPPDNALVALSSAAGYFYAALPDGHFVLTEHNDIRTAAHLVTARKARPQAGVAWFDKKNK